MALSEQIEQARRAGYADNEIAAYLAQQGLVEPAKIKRAQDAGYKAGEVLDFLSEPAERSTWENVKNVAGKTARDVVMGAAGLPLLVGDAANALINQPVKIYNARTGRDRPRLGTASGAAEELLTKIGLPKPEGRTEELVSGVNRVLSGTGAAGLAGKAGQTLAQSEVSKKLAGLFANNLGAQAGAGGTAVLAQDQARNALDVENPYALAGIGLGAGMLYPQGAAVTAPVGRGGAAFVKPFTETGQRTIAGNVLRGLATNPDAAAARIASGYPEYVPGSKPMTAEVAGDYGLMGAEGPLFKALDVRNLRGQRVSERNAARVNELNRIGRDPMAVLKAEAKRSAATNPMREEAFAKLPDTVRADFYNLTAPVLKGKIAEIRKSSEGAGNEVVKAMNEMETWLTRGTTPERLYRVRRDMGEAMRGKYFDKPELQQAKHQIGELVDRIDEVLEFTAPGYGKYMETFKKMSIPIEQMKAIQKTAKESEMLAVDPTTGMDLLSAAKLKARANSVIEDQDIRLSKTQRAALDRIVKDVERGASTNSGVARAAGSDTFKNMSMGALLGRLMGKDVSATEMTLPKATLLSLKWMYSLPDQKVADLLVEAMLDPLLYRELVKTASLVKVEPLSQALKAKAIQSGLVSGTTGAQLDMDSL